MPQEAAGKIEHTAWGECSMTKALVGQAADLSSSPSGEGKDWRLLQLPGSPVRPASVSSSRVHKTLSQKINGEHLVLNSGLCTHRM